MAFFGDQHPVAVGDRTTAMVLARLLEVYSQILIPFGENQRYDLLIEDGSCFLRVQCKTGRLRNGVIKFNACSVTYHHPSNRGTREYKRDYRGSADLFGSTVARQTRSTSFRSIRWAQRRVLSV